MSDPRLFVPPNHFDGDTVHITGPDHLHLARVLRARPGDPILLLDNQGNAFHAVLVSVEKAATIARTVAPAAVAPEPTVSVTVAQALGKGDKFEQVVQHGVEIGACAFVPIRADRSVVDIPAARLQERILRWRQIAKGAAEQSGRARIPEVTAPQRLNEALHGSVDFDACLLLHTVSESARSLRDVLTAIVAPTRLLIAIGPEGGWSSDEVETARSADAAIVTLGGRILRTETAALAAVSQILYHFERM